MNIMTELEKLAKKVVEAAPLEAYRTADGFHLAKYTGEEFQALRELLAECEKVLGQTQPKAVAGGGA